MMEDVIQLGYGRNNFF